MPAVYEQVDAGPIADWCNQRVARYEEEAEREARYAGAGDIDAQAAGVARLAHELFPPELAESGKRYIYRWRRGLKSGSVDRIKGEYPTETQTRGLIQGALDRLEPGLFYELYPECEVAVGDVHERFCPKCLSVEQVGDDSLCPWCETPTLALGSLELPPRKSEVAAAPRKRHCVKHTPRVRKGRPFYFDVLLDRRERALRRFVRDPSFLRAVRPVWKGAWSSQESAGQALRTLCIREGWYTPSGRKGGDHGKPTPEVVACRRAVRRALREGTWDRVLEDVPSPSQRRVFDEDLLHEAVWLYFYDQLSFGKIAERLYPRVRCASVSGLKTLLNDEWNKRGWPRRTHSAAIRAIPKRERMAKGKARCTAVNRNGKRCRRHAKKDRSVCRGHDPSYAQERRRLAKVASLVAYADAVPIEPWRNWLRARAQELGSVKAVHARFNGVASYDLVADWTDLWQRGGRDERITVVTRSKIDACLEQYGDGTTFEDVYPIAVIAA